MFPAMKSVEKTPLKSTQFTSNDYCRICRINLKISGHLKECGIDRVNKNFVRNDREGSVLINITTEHVSPLLVL